MLQPPPLSADHFPAPAMSAECEAAPPQSLASTLPSASPRTATTSKPPERHGASGISYEGRVSVIPPLAGYEATMRAAMELDRAHGADQQLGHGDRQFGTPQMQQDLRRLYEQRVRMHEASQMYEAARQAYPKQNEVFIPKEEPLGEQEGEAGVPRGEDTTMGRREPSPQACHSQVKEEPHDGEADAGEGFSFPRQDNDSVRSPINKAGESPDLPTDCARTQAAEDLHYKHNDSSDRMSPYEESLQGNEERMPSSVEQDCDDTTDSIGAAGDGDMDHLSRLQQAMQLSGVMSGRGEGDEDKQLFQCHLCSYSCASRCQFNTHLNTHYDHKCTKCEFTTHAEPKLREHLQEEHGLSPDCPEDMEGIRVPRVNAQGKVKTFKCKQCDYVAITKGDFWEHARSHIKSEKLLACPKCPFVTEYKHHLEYHLRNHFGSKPFKCNKCNYSCVNKSMLNSHMKSHSNVYQYRCSDCTYATKYCHSLKLHLRKYGHNPAMVLNPDGTPNPIPIIDVYGTRRGPKLKKDEKGMPILPPHYQLQAQLLKAQMQANNALPPTTPIEPAPAKKTSRKPPPMPPVSIAGSPHSPYPYPYPSVMDNFQSSSPILSRALEKTSEEPRTLESREHLRDLLLERERAAQGKPPSPLEGLRCTLCDFVADCRETFSQHMMAHAASEGRDESNTSPRSPQAMEHSSGVSPERRSLSPARLPLFPHQAPPPPPPPPPLTSEASHMYAPLAAAHNLKEYLARAMNPFIYQQMVGGQIHPAFGLQQHLQQFTHPAFPGPRPLLPMEEDPRLNSPQSQPQAPPRLHSPQPKSQPQHQVQALHQSQQALSPTTEGVLDLSKEQTPLQQLSMVKEQTPPQQVRDTSKEPPPLQQQRGECRASVSPNHSSPQSSSPPRSETSTPPSKNRRKGRAFKLERIALRLSESAEGESSGHDEDARREEEESPGKGVESRMPPLMPLPQGDGPQDGQHEVWQGAHHCQFCDMAFKDVVMYTMHMGYHGYRNPFTCNMCGHQASDKVAFFLHIARSSHS
ncbi:Protein hunchback [Portunus trituberculatus]|uniref:Protein hunchback n=1 Tax=Portunus trituberculatus TaxID=210409 RepID=A0A5B7CQ03_PORTR|nr:Protein hunchback [Portunus trituberculatus]